MREDEDYWLHVYLVKHPHLWPMQTLEGVDFRPLIAPGLSESGGRQEDDSSSDVSAGYRPLTRVGASGERLEREDEMLTECVSS